MSAGFTPGPWHINSAASEEVISDSETMVICRTAPRLYQRTAVANAHLIAAAPDLYGALLKWQAYDDQDEADFSQHGPMLLYAEAIEATRAALARARGES